MITRVFFLLFICLMDLSPVFAQPFASWNNNMHHATGQKINQSYHVPTSQPSFQVDYAMPTADKPQSKVWYMNGSWWAILPRSSGPSLWHRTIEGWRELTDITFALKGVPGRADVWADGQVVTAVGVADHSLTVFRLSAYTDSLGLRWKSQILAELIPPSFNSALETATIALDDTGIWWVSAVADAKVCIWSSSSNGDKWTPPFVLAKDIDEDDICVVTPLRKAVGVIWSDQSRDAVLMRIHKNRHPAEFWEKEEIVEKGNNTADDHLNTSLAPDGTLWVATKNSVDMPGKPQFVMRIRSKNGRWNNIPYLNLERLQRPSRPIVVSTEDNSIIFAGHGDNDRSVPFPHDSKIIFARIDRNLSDFQYNPQIVISPDSALNSFVQNVTGPRHPFPLNGPWIILASDQEGRIYEADLSIFHF